MKNLIIETRMYLAELLLGWAIDIAPKNDEGMKLIVHVGAYFGQKIAERINK